MKADQLPGKYQKSTVAEQNCQGRKPNTCSQSFCHGRKFEEGQELQNNNKYKGKEFANILKTNPSD